MFAAPLLLRLGGEGGFLDVRESPEGVLSLPVTAERPFVGLTGQRELDFGVPLCRGYDYFFVLVLTESVTSVLFFTFPVSVWARGV